MSSPEKEYIDGCALWAVFKKTLAKMASNASSSEEESEDEAEEESEEEIPIPRPRKTTKTPKAAKSAKATPAKKGPSAVKPASVKPERPDDENDYVIGDNDDPYSLFYDNIVLLTDSDGDPISGPFLQLPSKKQYPDYYEDITQVQNYMIPYFWPFLR